MGLLKVTEQVSSRAAVAQRTKTPNFAQYLHHGMDRDNAHLSGWRWRRASRWGGAYSRPASAAGFGGGAFLQPAQLQHGSASVQHLCGGAAATGGPRAWCPGHCGCGCGAVRAGQGRRAWGVQGFEPGAGRGGWAETRSCTLGLRGGGKI